jgi:PAS domain S-box-containing protein
LADTSTNNTATTSFLKGGGEMGKLIRSKDWSGTLMGEPDEWPQSLRISLSILLNSKFPMFIFWGPELICFYNDAYRPSLGNDGKHPHILGMRGEEAWPEIWPIIKPLLDQVTSGGEAVWFENQLIPIYRNSKLEDVYWTFSYSPIKDEQGDIAGVLVTCTETTTQVINLKKLEESENNFRNLVDQAPVPAALYKGKDLIIELANEEVLKLWGKDESVIGKRLIDAIPELRGQPFIAIMEEVYATGVTYEGKEMPAYIEKNGKTETVYFNLIYKALHNGSGQINGILAMGFDVTAQMIARKKIEESDKKFRDTVMQAPVGITIFRGGEDFIVEMANESYLELIGKKEKDIVGKPFFESVPEVKAVVEPLLKKVLHTGVPYYGTEFEVQLNRYGRIEKAYFNFTYQALREEDGTISGVIVVANEVTSQVEARIELQQSETQFSNIVTQSPIAMTIWRGRDYIIEMANTALMKNIWRKEPHEVMGKKALEVFPELYDQKYPELLERVYTTGLPHRESEALAFIEGNDGMKRFYLDFEYSPLFDQDGTVSAIMITVNNVTEKVETRQMILDAEERLRIAVDASGLGTFESNIQTSEISYTDRYLEILGFDRVYRPTHSEIVERIHPDDMAMREIETRNAFETGILDYELRIVPQKNAVRWIRAKGKVMYDEQGNPLKISGGIIDITHEKITRQLIEESEKQLRQLADSMPQLVWMSEADGTISYYNHRYSEYKSEQTGHGWQWQRLLHPEDLSASMKEWNKALEQKIPYSIEHRLHMADESWRWHLSRAYPQFNGDGTIQMWVGTSTDIDDIKKHEQQKDDFIKMASHELKTPVTSVKGYVQLLQKLHEHDGNTMLNTYLSTIDKQVSKLTNLITDLLDVTKVETGTLLLNKQPFAIDELVANIAEDMQHTSPTHRIIVGDTIRNMVFADSDRISQVLINYITNAIKYSPKADKIIINIRSTDNEVIISVEDFGIGITAKDHRKIFERFYRVQGKDEHTFPGFGIGLYIVQEIISRHDGQTWVESEKDKGSVFYFSLPLHSI